MIEDKKEAAEWIRKNKLHHSSFIVNNANRFGKYKTFDQDHLLDWFSWSNVCFHRTIQFIIIILHEYSTREQKSALVFPKCLLTVCCSFHCYKFWFFFEEFLSIVAHCLSQPQQLLIISLRCILVRLELENSFESRNIIIYLRWVMDSKELSYWERMARQLETNMVHIVRFFHRLKERCAIRVGKPTLSTFAIIIYRAMLGSHKTITLWGYTHHTAS